MQNELILNKKVAYFSGCFANYYWPEVGRMAVSVLQRNGIEVIVPDQECCGLPMIAKGNIRGAQKSIERNIAEIYSAISRGYAAVTSCSSCSLMIKHDYPLLSTNPQAAEVAHNFYHITEYLTLLHEAGRLDTGFQHIFQTVFYHMPCHLRAQEISNPSVTMMQLIPGTKVTYISDTCCGMGGAYGYEKTNFTLSREIAEKLYSNIKEHPADRIVTDCGGCKLQIENGTRKKVTSAFSYNYLYYTIIENYIL